MKIYILTFKIPIQKCTLHIKMMKFPTLYGSHGDDSSHGRPFNYRGKSFMNIKAFKLFVTSSNKMCLTMKGIAKCIGFSFVNPLYMQRNNSRRAWHQIPRMICLNRGNLIVHSYNLIRISSCLLIQKRFIHCMHA